LKSSVNGVNVHSERKSYRNDGGLEKGGAVAFDDTAFSAVGGALLGVWRVVAWAVATHEIGMEESGDVGIVTVDHSAIANINVAVSILFQVVVKWTIDWLTVFGETENRSVWLNIPSVSNVGKDIICLKSKTGGAIVPFWVSSAGRDNVVMEITGHFGVSQARVHFFNAIGRVVALAIDSWVEWIGVCSRYTIED